MEDTKDTTSPPFEYMVKLTILEEPRIIQVLDEQAQRWACSKSDLLRRIIREWLHDHDTAA